MIKRMINRVQAYSGFVGRIEEACRKLVDLDLTGMKPDDKTSADLPEKVLNLFQDIIRQCGIVVGLMASFISIKLFLKILNSSKIFNNIIGTKYKANCTMYRYIYRIFSIHFHPVLKRCFKNYQKCNPLKNPIPTWKEYWPPRGRRARTCIPSTPLCPQVPACEALLWLTG